MLCTVGDVVVMHLPCTCAIACDRKSDRIGVVMGSGGGGEWRRLI